MKNVVIETLKRVLKLFYIFPIKQNRVVFSAYSGRSYSCSPKYITEELLKGEEIPEIIWAFRDPAEHKSIGGRIKTVKFKSLGYIYCVLTAKIVVDNVESWSILPKRKGQIVINTWHGGGVYKGVGLKRLDSSPEKDKNMLRKNERVTHYVSSSRAFTEMTLKDSFHFTGEVLETGMPRNDLLINPPEGKAERVKHILGLDPAACVAIFAPTFRGEGEQRPAPDAGRLIGALEERFGGEWILLARAHYYDPGQSVDNDKALNVSDYEDMQELLLISDVLITDYSSVIWDFCLTGRPGFLFAPDLKEYSEERDFYTPIEEWPYPYAEDDEGLEKLIASYEPEAAKERIREHLKRLGSFESGEAARKIAGVIMAEGK